MRISWSAKTLISHLNLICNTLKIKSDIPQLFLRLAPGIGFLLPVMDRFGWLGEAGFSGNAWGNWENFVGYTNTLMPFFDKSIAHVLTTV
ncbi:hypothetical protein [Dyadobacter sp. 3J3]|uniref:hypothetical protein n=1 Tax=Dyadobacter sp. 3J3 TaxID=2606600 RepID=UPI001358A284|nr:hypothetical protein [Dyadobacter sp. 3J3]